MRPFRANECYLLLYNHTHTIKARGHPLSLYSFLPVSFLHYHQQQLHHHRRRHPPPPAQPRGFWLSVSSACSIFAENLTADSPPVRFKWRDIGPIPSSLGLPTPLKARGGVQWRGSAGWGCGVVSRCGVHRQPLLWVYTELVQDILLWEWECKDKRHTHAAHPCHTEQP